MTFPLCAVQCESNALHFINLSVCFFRPFPSHHLTNVNEEIAYMPASQCTLECKETGFGLQMFLCVNEKGNTGCVTMQHVCEEIFV